MKISRILSNPVLIMFIAVAFLFTVTGCEKTVTKYKADGTPYTEQEFDPVASLAAFLIFSIGVGALAAVAAGSGSSLPNQHESMFAFAGSQDVVTDVPSGMSSSLRCIKFIDSKGNLIGRQVIDVDKLRASKSFVNISDVQVSSEINEKVLKDFVSGIAKANNITSLPDSIKADVSWMTDESGVLKINTVNVPQVATDSDGRASKLVVATEQGFYSITSVPDRAGHISVTVSQLGSPIYKEPARNFTH